MDAASLTINDQQMKELLLQIQSEIKCAQEKLEIIQRHFRFKSIISPIVCTHHLAKAQDQ